MREIKLRGIRIDNGDWTFGDGVVYVGNDYCAIPKTYGVTSKDYQITLVKVNIETVGQYTGLKDKNGKEIYEGDVLQWYTVDIEYQTHYGDNIPLGSYTEPCGTTCKKFKMPVIFIGAMFTCNQPHDPEEDEAVSIDCPIQYPRPYDRKELNYIFYPRPYGKENEVLSDEEFLEVAQSIAEDLGFECASIDDFIHSINGFEVIGNIYDNPELLSPK